MTQQIQEKVETLSVEATRLRAENAKLRRSNDMLAAKNAGYAERILDLESMLNASESAKGEQLEANRHE